MYTNHHTKQVLTRQFRSVGQHERHALSPSHSEAVQDGTKFAQKGVRSSVRQRQSSVEADNERRC